MAINVHSYNQQFLSHAQQGKLYNDAEKYGVAVKSLADQGIQATSGQYWRVIGIHHLTGAENMGNHHIYCDILDESGQRINQSRAILYQDGAAPLTAVVDKPPNEAGTNFPLWKSSHVSVAVDDALPSEQVINLTTAHPDEEEGNTLFHHSFYVVWQKSDVRPPKPSSSGSSSSGTTVSTGPSTGSSGTGTSGQNSPPAGPSSELEKAIAAKGEPMVKPVNPDSKLYKIAAQRRLGQHLTPEYTLTWQGKTYVAQVYEHGIVYAEDGNWRTLDVIDR